ncbi:hypothetical protein [Winogradskyella thalassocola]|uniref:Uncharacterized protein n=1 Tax=Winogradskyella thalassocola TaxID=262004 RepID=A0A1G8D0X2_9FLAO|nr:hypothetical protein [Winogradskyella thalassocola]SDH51341.1 hypothetical protein SAMN04489796_10395 [Winogradskyella thalassocola]
MKNLTVTFLLACLILGCKTETEKKSEEVGKDVIEILFQVDVTEKDDLEYFENGIIPWVSIENPDLELNNLIGKDDIVVNSNKATLIIDYPLNNPVEFTITSDKSIGFTRKELAQNISIVYHKIYEVEERTSSVKTIPIEEREGLINRNETNGKYGIWGHDIGDLDLSAAVVRKMDSGEIKIELFIES